MISSRRIEGVGLDAGGATSAGRRHWCHPAFRPSIGKTRQKASTCAFETANPSNELQRPGLRLREQVVVIFGFRGRTPSKIVTPIYSEAVCALELIVGFVALAITFGAVLLARWQWHGAEGRSSPQALRVVVISGAVALPAVGLTWAIPGNC